MNLIKMLEDLAADKPEITKGKDLDKEYELTKWNSKKEDDE